MKTRSLLNFLFISLGIVIQSVALYFTNSDLIIYYLITFIISMMLLGKIKGYPLSENSAMPLIFVFFCYVVLAAVFLIKNITYDNLFFILNVVFSVIWLTFWVYLKKRFTPIKLGYFKTSSTDSLINTERFIFKELDIDNISTEGLSGILYDSESKENEKMRFSIAELGIKDLPALKVSDIIERSSGKIESKYFSKLSFDDFAISNTYAFVKRVFDIIVCLIASPVLLVLMIVTGIGVKLDSKGPMFFTQERTGKGDKPFKMYKFRSMRTDSEKDGAKFASKNDSRITPFGKFIRKVRLDEIPQFYNILRGDMSLIGPRPEQKVFTDQFNEQIPFYPYRHAVRPGITGWAQVSQGYAATVEQTEQKVEYDLYYIKNFSLWLDLLIVLKTVRTILTGFGAR